MMKIKKYTVIFAIIIFFSCNNDKEAIKEHWPNGNTKISYIYSHNDTSVYLKKEFYENGKLMAETNFENNVQNGKGKWWYINGQIGKEESYQNGKLVEFSYWYENGTQKGLGNIIIIDTSIDTIAGVPTYIATEFGNIIYWKENGKKDYEMTIIDSLNAIIKRWDENGVETIENFKRTKMQDAFQF